MNIKQAKQQIEVLEKFIAEEKNENSLYKKLLRMRIDEDFIHLKDDDTCLIGSPYRIYTENLLNESYTIDIFGGKLRIRKGRC